LPCLPCLANPADRFNCILCFSFFTSRILCGLGRFTRPFPHTEKAICGWRRFAFACVASFASPAAGRGRGTREACASGGARFVVLRDGRSGRASMQTFVFLTFRLSPFFHCFFFMDYSSQMCEDEGGKGEREGVRCEEPHSLLFHPTIQRDGGCCGCLRPKGTGNCFLCIASLDSIRPWSPSCPSLPPPESSFVLQGNPRAFCRSFNPCRPTFCFAANRFEGAKIPLPSRARIGRK